MIREVVFGSQGWDEAKGGLDAGALRQRTIAANLANAATPGYRAREVAFEELLSDGGSRLPMAKTRPGHLGGAAPTTPRPQVRLSTEPRDGSGVNNVSVEREMTEMGQNLIHFQALSQFVANRYRAIRDAIRPGA